MKRKISPNFHGKKGRSGRKIFPIELAKIESIKKSWNIVKNTLEENNDVNIATQIALKDMTNKTEHSGKLSITFDRTFYEAASETEGSDIKQK